jgi:hypothetical protein
MILEKIKRDLSVCKIKSIEFVDFSREFVFLMKTPDEISLVCESAYLPPDVITYETDWKALRVSGILDFGMIGVIAKIANILAEIGIPIFVVSTYNTDYILMKAENFDKGVESLIQNSYDIK